MPYLLYSVCSMPSTVGHTITRQCVQHAQHSWSYNNKAVRAGMAGMAIATPLFGIKDGATTWW
jgi:hypothetical protein